MCCSKQFSFSGKYNYTVTFCTSEMCNFITSLKGICNDQCRSVSAHKGTASSVF